MPIPSRRPAPLSLAGLVLVPFVTPLLALAQSPGDARDEALRAFRAASAGDGRAAERAAALFGELSASEPRDPVLLAYAGAAEAMTGRDACSPLEGLETTEAGLARIDRALKLLGPADEPRGPGRLPPRLETWLVAASTFAAVPDDAFHRLGDAKSVLALAMAHPVLPHLPPGVRAQFVRVQAHIARTERRTADERAALEDALALEPSAPQADADRARIAELSR